MLRVLGIKFCTKGKFTRVLYERKGHHYIRTATDGFSKGEPIQHHVTSYFTKWGFRHVKGKEPTFRDGDELRDNIGKFGKSNDHTAVYSE